jgi:uncharacterized protein (TIGR02145 family)
MPSIPQNNSFTISLWVKPSSINGIQEFLHQNTSPNAFYIGTHTGILRCGDSYQSTGINIVNNIWQHLIIVRNFMNNVKIYFNGSLLGTSNSDISLGGLTTDPLVFGNQYGQFGEFFNGILDDIAIYNRALSQSEITQLYNANSCIANITTPDTSICRGSSITLNAAAVNSTSVTDINGNVYPTVNIGSQTWMQKNLNVSKYKNGDIIPKVTDPTQWRTINTGAWCWYNNDSASNATTYGKLYNWYAVNDPRGLAPEGWHVPSDGEWNTMVKSLDSSVDTTCIGCYQGNLVGGWLKSTNNWIGTNVGADNRTGFTALPGGSRKYEGSFFPIGVGYTGFWWTRSLVNSNAAMARSIDVSFSGIARADYLNNQGLSVRAIRNTPTYLWSTGATTPSITVSPTVTTKYYCTVSDGVNICKDSVTVTVSTITTNLITADTIKVCGTSTQISATTGLSSYNWSNGANTTSTTVTSGGWYKCTANNGACTAVDSVYVSLFNPKITQNDTTVCAGTPLTLTVNNNTALTSSLPANLRNGLVGYWPFNGNANDESGNGNHGTVNGATLTSDRFGNNNKAYNFTGSTTIPSYIEGNCNSFPTGNRTVSFWFFGNDIGVGSAGRSLLGYGGQTCGQSWLMNIDNFDNGGNIFEVQGHCRNQQVLFNYGANHPNGRWVHWVITTDNSNGTRFYLDGINVKNDPIFINQTIVAGKKFIFGAYISTDGTAYGWDSNCNPFNGFLDDIAIYNRALSSNEIQQLYSGTSYLWSTGATTQSISVIPTATTSYIATVSNGINTCKDTVKITVANITSLSPAAIFGPVDVCAAIGSDTASIPVNYRINKIANAASYVWTVPAGATLLSGQGDTSIFVRFRSSFVSGAITVKSVSTCNISSATRSLTVFKRVAAAPAAIQNQFSPTSIAAVTNVTGSVSQIYRIRKVPYATSYNWYLNRGTNASITHINPAGVNDTAVIVTFASCFVRDTLSVKSVTPCSISAAKTVIMSSSTSPTTVVGITTVGGDFAVCVGSTKIFTAVANTPTTSQVRIASYRWTKPANTTITAASSDSSSITLSINTGFTGGSISARGVSSCGVIGTVACSAVLQFLPPTPLSIGSSTNSYNACINNSITYTALVGTTTTAQAPAASFRWTRPNNTTITSASADSSSITLLFNSGYTGGIISVRSLSRCGTQSAARTRTLTNTGCTIGSKSSLPITSNNVNAFEVNLFPNPSVGAFKLFIKNTATERKFNSTAIVKVIDAQGRMMKSFTTYTNQVVSIGNELKSGVYMVEVRIGEEVKVVRAVKF